MADASPHVPPVSRGGIRPWLAAGVTYAAITLAMASSFVDLRQLGSVSFGGDGRLIVWTVAWTTRALLHGHPLFDANMFFPASATLAYTEHMVGVALLAVPLRLLTENPVLVFSLLWLGAFWTNALSAHLLAYRFTRRHDAAFIAGLIFAWSFFRMSHAGHLQLQWTAWLPLAILLIERWHARLSWSALLAATGALLMQMLTSWYLAVLAAITGGAWGLWLCAVKGNRDSHRAAVQLAVATALGAIVLWPLAIPYLHAHSAEPAVPAYAADLASYLSPPEDTWVGRLAETRLGLDARWLWGEQTMFLGWTTVALACVGVWAIGRDVTSARRHERRQHLLPLFFVLLVVLAFWMSLGAFARVSLFEVVGRLPGLSLFRAPARFGLLVMLGVAVVASLGLALILESVRSARAVRVLVTVIGLVMLAEWRVVTGAGRATPAPIPPIYQVLNALPAGPVMSLPDYRLGPEFYLRADYLLYSTAHWRPIVNGYGRSEPREYRSNVEQLSTFPSPASAARARALGVRYIIVHAGQLQREDALAAARASASFREVARVGSDYLFEVTASPVSR